HRAQVTGLARVRVTDGAVAVAHRLDHARGALSRLATVHRPAVAGLVRPFLRRGGLEVLGELLGGAGLVRAVDRGDPQVGQIDVRVVGGDLRVVPLGDLLVEDLRDGAGLEVQLVDALQVEDHRDRGHVRRDLHDLAATLLSRRQFVVGQEGVGTAEVGPAVDELLTTPAGADGVVVRRDVGVAAEEAGLPRLLRGLLRAGARTRDRPRQFRSVAALVVAPFVDRTACRDAEGERGSRRESDHAAQGETLHGRPLPQGGGRLQPTSGDAHVAGRYGRYVTPQDSVGKQKLNETRHPGDVTATAHGRHCPLCRTGRQRYGAWTSGVRRVSFR